MFAIYINVVTKTTEVGKDYVKMYICIGKFSPAWAWQRNRRMRLGVHTETPARRACTIGYCAGHSKTAIQIPKYGSETETELNIWYGIQFIILTTDATFVSS